MTKGDLECLCIVDTDGLHGIAAASGNLHITLLDHLDRGVIAVPACAWKEFSELYEEEATVLAPYIKNKIIMKHSYYVGAARIADSLNSGFPRGAHDDSVELYTGSIAAAKRCCILTSTAQVTIYNAMGCDASDIESWVARQA